LKEKHKMDPKLAEVYKTNQADETDVEALATAALAEKLASADEVDVSGLSDDEAEALAAQILEGEAPAEEPQAEGDEPAAEGEEKTAGEELTPEQEKIAEADYLGRVMAHAYVAERREIEKEASKMDAVREGVNNLKGAVAMTGAAASKKMDAAKAGAKAAKGKVMEHVGKHSKKYMGGAAAAIGAGGFAAGRKSKKASAEQPAETEERMSALDTLALARAHEILKEHGIDPNAEQETEKKSSINEEQAALLQEKVNERAMAMLADAGYTIGEQQAEEEQK
jgi:hypothetical protein